MRMIARLNIGGPAIHVTLLAGGLRDDEFWTTLVTGQIGAQEGDMSYLAHEIGVEPVVLSGFQREIAPLDDLKTLWALMRLIRQERPHVVHTHTAKAGLVGRLAATLCGVPVIVHTYHGHVFQGYFGPVKTRLFLGLERGAARLSDVILTISEGLRDDLIAFRIAPPERIRVLPLGLDLKPLTDLDSRRGALRKELNLSTDGPLVGIIGRLVPIKHHELFFDAARRVLEALPQARFVVVGSGEREAELREYARKLGMGHAVTFLGWRRDLPAIYADLDLVVIASRNEGTPVSLIEAMAAGVPVVATSVGGVPDLLRGGQLGTLVAPDDAEALAEAMMHSLRAPNPARIAAARDWVLARYSAERLVADIRSLYRELLTQKGVLFATPEQKNL